MGVTQKKLAILAGTSQPTIAAYEAGKKSPTLQTLGRLAKSLGLEIDVSFISPMSREDLRSLAYHRVIVEKLQHEPVAILAKAQKNIEIMSKKHPDAKKLFDRWKQWLVFPIDDLINSCLNSSVFARDMRQVTPFAGVLSAKERLEIIKAFRKGGNS